MSKEFLNTLSIEEIKERLYKGERIYNETDNDAYVRYVAPIGICRFQKKTDKLISINLTLTLFSHLYFDDLKEDYESMIGCVGWFWDDSEKDKSFGVLTEYKPEYERPFRKNTGWTFSHFQPAKKSELKFWEDEE